MEGRKEESGVGGAGGAWFIGGRHRRRRGAVRCGWHACALPASERGEQRLVAAHNMLDKMSVQHADGWAFVNLTFKQTALDFGVTSALTAAPPVIFRIKRLPIERLVISAN